MANIFITGSSDGLGLMTGKMLIQQGHQVVLHARNSDREKETRKKLSTAHNVLVADLSSMDETKELAEKVNELGRFDAIIHNAGVYQTSDKLIMAVNTLAPYILTCLIQRPQRLIYLSSGMHMQGRSSLKNLLSGTGCSYSDSKLHVLWLSMSVARKWPDVYSNAVNPGWVPTKMGGAGAPDDLDKGFETQAWLAVSDEPQAKVSGRYFHHKKERHFLPEAGDVQLQEKFLDVCEQVTGIKFPKRENADRYDN